MGSWESSVAAFSAATLEAGNKSMAGGPAQVRAGNERMDDDPCWGLAPPGRLDGKRRRTGSP